MGYCDESLEAWRACPIGRKRPHKSCLFAIFNAYQRNDWVRPLAGAGSQSPLAPLDEGDFRVIEQFTEARPAPVSGESAATNGAVANGLAG